jgi:hypothetical protein
MDHTARHQSNRVLTKNNVVVKSGIQPHPASSLLASTCACRRHPTNNIALYIDANVYSGTSGMCRKSKFWKQLNLSKANFWKPVSHFT